MNEKTKQLKALFYGLYGLEEIECRIIGDNKWRMLKYSEKGYSGYQPFVIDIIIENYIVYRYDEEDGICTYMHMDIDEDFIDWKFK